MKTKEEIFEQSYISAKDLKMLIPSLGINRCVKYINDVQEEIK